MTVQKSYYLKKKKKKENVSYLRINDETLYEHTESNGVVLDFTLTIEEVTI